MKRSRSIRARVACPASHHAINAASKSRDGVVPVHGRVAGGAKALHANHLDHDLAHDRTAASASSTLRNRRRLAPTMFDDHAARANGHTRACRKDAA